MQEYAADLFGHEAALFAPSGTQSNLLALLAHCGRGDEYLVGQEAHTYRYEGGGAAVLGSIQPQPIVNQPDGSIALADIEAQIKPDDFHFARTRLLALENTIGGRVLGADYIKQATDLAHARGLATHLDGARICNAAVKQGVSLRAAVAGFDSVSVCLSKGLGAPVGSVLCGTKPLIAEAQTLAQDAGRRHAPGRRDRGGRLVRAGAQRRSGWPRTTPTPPTSPASWPSSKASRSARRRPISSTSIFRPMRASGLSDVFELTRIRVSMSPHLRIVTHMDASRDDIDRAINVFGDFFG